MPKRLTESSWDLKCSHIQQTIYDLVTSRAHVRIGQHSFSGVSSTQKVGGFWGQHKCGRGQRFEVYVRSSFTVVNLHLQQLPY